MCELRILQQAALNRQLNLSFMQGDAMPRRPKTDSSKKTNSKTNSKTSSEVIEAPTKGWRRVRSHPDYDAHPDGFVRRRETKRIVGGWVAPATGSRMIALCGEKKKTLPLARVIAEAFVRQPKQSTKRPLRVQYIDGDRGNVRASNLGWSA